MFQLKRQEKTPEKQPMKQKEIIYQIEFKALVIRMLNELEKIID